MNHIRKKAPKPDTSLEERIRMLTCDVDEPLNEGADTVNGRRTLERRRSPTGEENPQPQVTKYVPDKSFSPISTASSSSSSSISAYKKITDIFHKDKRQERIPEADENPIVIIPQVSTEPQGVNLNTKKNFNLNISFDILAVAARLPMSTWTGSRDGNSFIKCQQSTASSSTK